MKALKIFGIIIVVLLLVVAILGVVAPKEYRVEKSVEISAPKGVVFEQVVSLRKMDKWSPWRAYDPDMKVTYEGEDGVIGSKSIWDGNEDVGKGEQMITAISDNRVDIQVKFIEPWESISTSDFVFSDTENGVKITWGFEGVNPFPYNIMGLFMNMDDAIGKDFENGLKKLKEISEDIAANMPEEPVYKVTETTFSPKVYIGIRDTVQVDQMHQFYGDNLGAAFQAVQAEGIRPGGAPSGMYYHWDMDHNKTFMAAAVPVQGDSTIAIEGFETIFLDSAKALHIAYYGAYDKVGGAHEAMDRYLKEHGLEHRAPVIEEYITDPSQEPDTSKWLTNIYYFLN